MEGDDTAMFLDRLTARVEGGWEDVGQDRKMFFEGLRHLQRQQIKQASKVFRRASRRCAPPFDVMARMAQARCEVVRGRQAVAMRLFEQVADGDGPAEFCRLAWREVADLARLRGDAERLRKAKAKLGDEVRTSP